MTEFVYEYRLQVVCAFGRCWRNGRMARIPLVIQVDQNLTTRQRGTGRGRLSVGHGQPTVPSPKVICREMIRCRRQGAEGKIRACCVPSIHRGYRRWLPCRWPSWTSDIQFAASERPYATIRLVSHCAPILHPLNGQFLPAFNFQQVSQLLSTKPHFSIPAGLREFDQQSSDRTSTAAA